MVLRKHFPVLSLCTFYHFRYSFIIIATQNVLTFTGNIQGHEAVRKGLVWPQASPPTAKKCLKIIQKIIL